MKPIYCIIEDDTYDYCRVVGYVDSEDEAQQICAQHNTSNHMHWFYETAEKLAPPSKPLNLAYIHEIVFDRVSRNPLKYKMRDEPGRYIYFKKNGKLPDATLDQRCSGIILITIPMCKNDRQRAEDKAATLLAKFVLSGELAGEKGSVQKWKRDLLS